MRIFNLPDLGEGLQEAEIVEWHVKPGDSLAADQAMVSVETDKAIVEVPAPFEGRVEKLFAEAGETVRVGAPLVGFAGEIPDSGTVVGELVETKAKATPAVRALARNLNVDLATVRGTGPEGLVTAEDVKQAARGAPAGAAGEEPLRGLRRAMARNMTLAHDEVAAVTIMDDADVTNWPERTPVLARLVRALVAACRAEPGLNAWYEAKNASRRVFEEVHVGIAVDTPEGLLVPVLRDAHRGFEEPQLRDLVEKARSRSLPPELLRGATITLSNYGTIAGRYATPMVVPPSIAILGAGRLALRPWVMADGALAARRILPLSLTFDHRAATGGEAGRFLNAALADLVR